jgi:hypothetical protein
MKTKILSPSLMTLALSAMTLSAMTLSAMTLSAQTNWNPVAATMMATSYSNSVKSARANVTTLSTVTPYIGLAWNLPTNAPTNYATVIISSTDLTLPVNQWSVEFSGTGCTNCDLPMTNAHKFYAARGQLN